MSPRRTSCGPPTSLPVVWMYSGGSCALTALHVTSIHTPPLLVDPPCIGARCHSPQCGTTRSEICDSCGPTAKSPRVRYTQSAFQLMSEHITV
ncbi:hypothetical protein OH76DRAFT_1054913 [Lentinus brumalis]|uniref:Uncharacterized protein n=1 Tax=Lentinus brumalis TaxID=2498619 RepID=A0A371DN89_9APHY|nr:hypothetical protein OH76DRAFT_1054913 [Polyporus brumalis]